MDQPRVEIAKVCVCCGDPAHGQGEHVLPKWLLKRWNREDGPFTYEIKGYKNLTKSGEPQKANPFPPFLLPLCGDAKGGHNCNSILNRLYEVPGGPEVRAVIDHGDALETEEQVQNFARWWVKTILLLQHPDCRNTLEGVNRLQPSWDLPASVYENLVKGERGILPTDVSLWLAISDDSTGSRQLPELVRNFLPTTSNPERGGGKPNTLLVGFQMKGTQVLLLQMVIHPLCDFDHPFEQAGLSVRLWPDPPRCLVVNKLPVLGSEGRRQLGALFVDGSIGINLPEPGWRCYVETVPGGGSLKSPILIAPYRPSTTTV